MLRIINISVQEVPVGLVCLFIKRAIKKSGEEQLDLLGSRITNLS